MSDCGRARRRSRETERERAIRKRERKEEMKEKREQHKRSHAIPHINPLNNYLRLFGHAHKFLELRPRPSVSGGVGRVGYDWRKRRKT